MEEVEVSNGHEYSRRGTTQYWWPLSPYTSPTNRAYLADFWDLSFELAVGRLW